MSSNAAKKTGKEQGSSEKRLGPGKASGPKKRRSTSWKPGQSGNPKGRPKSGEALAEVLRENVSPKAVLDRMKWLADNAESETVRYHALNWLAERGWGKAPQEVIFSQKNPYAKKVKGLSIAQLEIIATVDEELFELEVSETPEADGPSGVN